MLSQVERGETSPTLAVAERIAAGMELTLSQLLRLDDADGVSVVRAADRRHGGGGRRGHRYEVLTPPMPGLRAEVSLHTLAPGAVTGGEDDPPMHEPGARETAVVLEGGLRLVCAGVPHELGDGRRRHVRRPTCPHHFENPGEEHTRFFAVVAAGLRRS